MQNFSPVILGIDPGAKQIGIAVFRGGELLFYAVKSIKKRGDAETLRKVRKVVGKLIGEYRVECAAIEKIACVQQSRSFVKRVYEEITDCARTEGVRLYEYHPQLIRRIVCERGVPTKETAAVNLSRRYPDLVRYLNMPNLWQKHYYARLFGAIAAGVVCLRELEETRSLSARGKG